MMKREEARKQLLEFIRIFENQSLEETANIALAERTGKWILECDSEGEGDNLYRCSECGCKYSCQEYDKPNFCLDCGARMFGEEKLNEDNGFE